MKKFTKCVLSTILAVSMTFSTLAFVPMATNAAASDFISAGTGFENMYAEWASFANADGYNAYSKESSSSNYVKVDDELLRGDGKGNFRVDVLGLKGKTSYDLKIVPIVGGSEVESKAITYTGTPMAYDRSGGGFHKTSDAPGAYNMDGTLPSDATVYYVTEENKDTVTSQGIKGCFEKGSSSPVVVRVIGTIRYDRNGYPLKGISSDAMGVFDTQKITIEGVGTDATILGFGFYNEGTNDIEYRNLTFSRYPEDALGFEGCERIWIHNNNFLIGYNDHDNTAEKDKANGDGSTDLRESEYITVSYNHYLGCDKTSLIGSSASNRESTALLSFHHNIYESTKQRGPRVRWHNAHVYNNYYLNGGRDNGYCVGAACNASIFAENNYFENTEKPLVTSRQGAGYSSMGGNDGGVIKAYGNVFKNCTNAEAGVNYFQAPSKDYKMTASDFTTAQGGFTYNNFDTNGSMYSNYELHTAEEAKEICLKYSGPLTGGKLTVDPTIDATVPDDGSTGGNTDFVGDPIATYTYDADKSGSTGTAFGTNGFLTSSKSFSLKSSTGTADGKSYDGCFVYTRDIPVSFTVKNPGTLQIVHSSSSTTVRTITITDENGNSINSFSTAKSGAAASNTVKLPKAGKYNIENTGSGDAIIYFVEVKEYNTSSTGTQTTTKKDTTTETTTKETTTQTTTQTTTKETTTETTTQNTDPSVTLGDVDNSGSLTASDAANVLAYVLSSDAFPFNDTQLKAADVTKDNVITSSDAASILAKVLDSDYKF